MNIEFNNFTDKGWDWKQGFGYPQDEFYTDANTKYYKCMDTAPDGIMKYADENFSNYSVSMVKQPPGNFIPYHTDGFFIFKERFGEDKPICRYQIFLEDWQPGHYFEVEGKSWAGWKKGDVCVLENERHVSGNAGGTYKYTAQITGTLK